MTLRDMRDFSYDERMTTPVRELTATLTLMPQCANAGAPLTAASSAPSPSPSAILLDATEYHAAISETKRSCDGDTCAVTARVAVGYTGVEDDPGRALVKVTITGGSEPESRSVIVDSDEVNTGPGGCFVMLRHGVATRYAHGVR